jgi:histidinol phosphatase-like enzyme
LALLICFHHIYALKGNIRAHPDPKRGDALRMPEGQLNVVPKEERKPNPELLFDICHREGIRPEDAWYVGDSLIKDVAMANRAGVTAVRVDPAVSEVVPKKSNL